MGVVVEDEIIARQQARQRLGGDVFGQADGDGGIVRQPDTIENAGQLVAGIDEQSLHPTPRKSPHNSARRGPGPQAPKAAYRPVRIRSTNWRTVGMKPLL